MPFPDITSIDFSLKGTENQSVHDMLDYASSKWEMKSKRRERLEMLYNAYNGIVNEAEIDSIIKTTGRKSKTKYIKYRLGRSKMKQLHGEFLKIPIEASVTSINRDAQNERMQKYKTMLGMSLAKPFIEKARQVGYNVFEGIQIPDKNDKSFWNINNFKLANEIVMNTILQDKLKNDRLKIQFYQNFVDLTIAAEVFGKNERDVNGKDTYRYIPAKYALYEESVYDPFLERSPYLGEVRYMYLHELLTSKEFDLNNLQKEEIKKMAKEMPVGESGATIERIDGHPAFPVYTIQWKGLEEVVEKISLTGSSKEPYRTILSKEYYSKNKKKIDYEVQIGKYQIKKYYREILWTASKIYTNIYTSAKTEKNLIQLMNDNGKYNVDFDYTGMLFSTVNGYRISLQEVIYEMERIYDDVRFMINKEIRKIRGDTLVYNDAYIPKGKRFIDILHSISEDGVVRYNSSAEGNESGTEGNGNNAGIDALNLGQNQNFVVLLNQAMDIERVMDRITGMNDSRQGLERATTTATTNNNNLEASQSMTYDMFYFMKEYIERVLMKLCEKTKINIVFSKEDSRQFVLSDDETQYLIATKNLIFHNYAVHISDGRKEQSILGRIETMFPQEINAGLLRTKDVAKFFMEENFAKAIKILDQAHDELAKIREEEMRISQESKQQETQSKIQIAQENREDNQEHEKEMKLLDIEGKKEIAVMTNAMKATQDFQNNIAKGSMQKQKEKNIFE